MLADHPAYTLGEEIAHSLTHGLGLVASVAALLALVTVASGRGDAWDIFGCSVFGITLVALYAASTLYHGVPGRASHPVFQKLDHVAIYLLIAGTYTPVALGSLDGTLGLSLLVAVWVLAAIGIWLELWARVRSRHFAVPLYLTMGWMIAIALEPLAAVLHPDGLVLLLVGGIAYTAGVVFYAWQRLPYNHAVWHVFVLAGSTCHVSCVLGYVVPGAG